MGLSKKYTSESSYLPSPKEEKVDVNKCTIDKIQIFGDKYIVVQLQYSPKYYPNHGGKKIAVYKIGLLDFINQYGKANSLDPHFTDDPKLLTPIARFAPSEESWKSAIRFIESEMRATSTFTPRSPHVDIEINPLIFKDNTKIFKDGPNIPKDTPEQLDFPTPWIIE